MVCLSGKEMTEIFTIIGVMTVAVLSSVLLLVSAILLYAFWTKGFGRLSDYFFDRDNVWKMRASGVFAAISLFEFHKIPAVWSEAKELVNDND